MCYDVAHERSESGRSSRTPPRSWPRPPPATVVITDRGRPVAMLVPYEENRIQALIDAGLATPPKRSLRDLPPPRLAAGGSGR